MLVFAAQAYAPQYLVDDCQLVNASGRRQLLSSDVVNTCVIQRTRRLGDRSFAVAGPLCGTVSLSDFATSTSLTLDHVCGHWRIQAVPFGGKPLPFPLSLFPPSHSPPQCNF